MTYANMVDSEEFKKYRRMAYSKLYCYLELLKGSDSLKEIPHREEFQKLILQLVNTNDTKL